MSASGFDQQLLRLKSALGVSEDQEVARALDLSKAAFSDRKRRGAFPEDKVWALAHQKPELGIDPVWVLTGKGANAVRPGVEVLTAQARAVLALQAERMKGMSAQEQLQHALAVAQSATLDDEEWELISLYRVLRAAGREKLMRTAREAVAGLQVAAERSDSGGAATQDLRGASIRGGVAARDIVNKGARRKHS